MDRIKEKISSLQADKEKNEARIDELEKEVKRLEQELSSKESDVTSWSHKHTQLEADVEKLEAALAEAKKLNTEGANQGVITEGLTRKLAVLEEEIDATEKQLKETVEKLRLTDVKAEHFERKVTAAEADRDNWENKYNEELEKHKKTKKELDDLAASLEGI
ncbi:Tropomyosin-2 [Arthrobotrys entomopaga]|nr:Tropomyosin-2 [Arthrobotrys entomopaga]